MANEGFRGPIGFGPGGHRVHLGCVNEVDTQGHRSVQDGVGSRLIDLFTKGHGAQTNGGDVQIALSQANRVELEWVHRAEFTVGQLQAAKH